MNNNKLTLSMHFMKGDRGNLVFKKLGNDCLKASFRINRLCGALNFVGSMKQLIMAIAWGGEQHCFYPLRNDTGREWFLYCRTSGGQIVIAVCGVPGGDSVFEWEGNLEGFRSAIEGMIERMGRYGFFADYRC